MPRRKQILKQSHKLAQSQNVPTLTQAKGYKYLLFKALPTLKPGSIHLCPAAELKNAIGFHDYQELRVAMEGLSAIQIHWEALGRSDVVWGRSSLLASCVLLEDGNFSYAFDPQTVQELIQPTRYRRLNLELMLGFQSNYALKIYEAAWHYYDVRKQWGRTPGMNRDKLKQWLNVPGGSYKQHRDFFRRGVLDPLKEVNVRGELIVTFHHDGGKPRVRQFWFEARPDPQRQLSLPLEAMVEEPANTLQVSSATPEPEPILPLEPMSETEKQKAIAAFGAMRGAIAAVVPPPPTPPSHRRALNPQKPELP